MRTFSDSDRLVDLNPRQFYIILRKDNEQYHKLYKSIAKASKNDDIRFCIIDTTDNSEQTLKITALYNSFMGKDKDCKPWDFIIRDYPDDGNFSFSCWHRLSDNESEIKNELEKWKKTQEEKMWHCITSKFCGYFGNNTSSHEKINRFFDSLDKIMLSKGLTPQQQKDEINKLASELSEYADESSINLVKNFVGDNVNIIDSFFNIKTPRNISDEYMRCFLETGGYIAKPKLEIIRRENRCYKGNVHDKYQLEVTTTSGQTQEVTFRTVNSFAMYIFYMLKNKTPIYKENFYPNKETFKEYCEYFLAIYAAITDGIGKDTTTIIKDENGKINDGNEKIRRVINDLKCLNEKKDSFWKNANGINNLLRDQLGEKEAVPFLIKTAEGDKRRHKYWLEFNPDDLIRVDQNLSNDINKYKRKITNFGIFNSDNENTLQSVH